MTFSDNRFSERLENFSIDNRKKAKKFQYIIKTRTPTVAEGIKLELKKLFHFVVPTRSSNQRTLLVRGELGVPTRVSNRT